MTWGFAMVRMVIADSRSAAERDEFLKISFLIKLLFWIFSFPTMFDIHGCVSAD